ncbi:MAG: hypothetical protein Kow00129_11090 [Thermoleophilia bacterium]
MARSEDMSKLFSKGNAYSYEEVEKLSGGWPIVQSLIGRTGAVADRPDTDSPAFVAGLYLTGH